MNDPIPSRVSRSKRQASDYYSSISRFYDLLSAGAEARLRDETIRRLNLRAGEKVLEIGSGTGRGIRRILDGADSSGTVVGIDLAPGMLAAARENLRRSGKEGRTGLICADGASIPLRPEWFDAAFMGFTLELFDTPELPRVLAGIRRVLKPRGKLGLVAMGLPVNPNWMSRLYLWTHKRFPVLVDCRPIDARACAEDAGFKIRQVTRESMFSLPVDIVLAEK